MALRDDHFGLPHGDGLLPLHGDAGQAELRPGTLVESDERRRHVPRFRASRRRPHRRRRFGHGGSAGGPGAKASPGPFSLTLAGAACMMTAQIAWWLFVFPVNNQMINWTPESLPADFVELRNQWEYTHALRAILQIIGLSALVLSLLAETPTGKGQDEESSGS